MDRVINPWKSASWVIKTHRLAPWVSRILILLLPRKRVSCRFSDRSSQRVANQTIRDLLFSNYDKDVRPDHGGTYSSCSCSCSIWSPSGFRHCCYFSCSCSSTFSSQCSSLSYPFVFVFLLLFFCIFFFSSLLFHLIS